MFYYGDFGIFLGIFKDLRGIWDGCPRSPYYTHTPDPAPAPLFREPTNILSSDIVCALTFAYRALLCLRNWYVFYIPRSIGSAGFWLSCP